MAFDIDLVYLCPLPKGERDLPYEEDVERLVQCLRHEVAKLTLPNLEHIAAVIDRLNYIIFTEEEADELPYCAPCPHCGEEMIETYAADRKTVAGFQHPEVKLINGKPSCMPGHHVGIKLLDVWNMRDGEVPEGIEMVSPPTKEPQFYMEIRKDADGRDYPIFNTTGSSGTPVTMDMVNDTIMWYKSMAK